MTTTLIDGKAIAQEIQASLVQRIDALLTQGVQPTLLIVTAQPTPATQSYIAQKQKMASQLGVRCIVQHIGVDDSLTDAQQQLLQLLRTEQPHGVIVQLPLAQAVDPQPLLDTIPLSADIDCLSAASMGLVLANQPNYMPPTGQAVLAILEKHKVTLRGQTVALVGFGRLVGQPLLPLLIARGATVLVATEHTTNLAALTKQASIVISGVGKPKLIAAECIAPQAVCIDAGFARTEQGISGDMDQTSLNGIARLLTPTPGGVGPLTVISLFANLVRAAEQTVQGLST